MGPRHVGPRGVVALAGEAGYGKTALVEAFLASLARKDDPVRIGRGRCSERLAGSDAYLPVLEAARVAAAERKPWQPRSRDEDRRPELVYAARLAARPKQRRNQGCRRADRSAQRLKREMTALVEEASRLVPIVLFLDDLHWADPATVDLLSYLSVLLPSSRVLVVTTHRPSVLAQSKHPFLSLKLDLQARGVGREIALHTLPAEAVTAYIDGAFPGHTFPAAFATLIHHKTEGHPLFMVDLLRDLKQRGLLAERDGRWTLVEGLASLEREAPESVRSMIERKVAAISEDDRQLLAAASVQGADFDSAIVAFALELDEADVEERLDRARTRARLRALRRRKDVSGSYGHAPLPLRARALSERALRVAARDTSSDTRGARLPRASCGGGETGRSKSRSNSPSCSKPPVRPSPRRATSVSRRRRRRGCSRTPRPNSSPRVDCSSSAACLTMRHDARWSWSSR